MAQPTGRYPALQRVRKRWEFELIQAQARRVSTPAFVFLQRARDPSASPTEGRRPPTRPSPSPTEGRRPPTRPSPSPTGARLGVTASRKLGSAVVRNRAKRLIREAFRATRDLWPDDVDVVVVARRPLTGMKLAGIVAEWRGATAELKRRQNQARQDCEARKSSLAPSA